jgi:hypothetical protein
MRPLWRVLLVLAAAGCDTELTTGIAGPGTVSDSGAYQPPPPLPDAGPPRVVEPTRPDGGAAGGPDAGSVTQILHDMEDGSINFASLVGVLGSWFAAINYVAGRAPLPLERLIEPVVPPRGASTLACHVKAGRYEDGVDLFVDFHPISRLPDFNHANLGAYAGIAFWARSETSDRLFVAIADDRVNGQEDFWKAELEGRPWPSRQLILTPAWERYVLLFEDVRAREPAPGRAVNTGAINSFHFLAGVGGVAVDFWIDDVAMLCRGPCP